MESWSVIVIALMVILTAVFVSYPLYSMERAPSTPASSTSARRSRRKKRREALRRDRGEEARLERKRAEVAEPMMADKELEEEIERQVRALRRRK